MPVVGLGEQRLQRRIVTRRQRAARSAESQAPVRQNVVSRRELFIVIFLFIGYPPNPDAYGRDV